MHFPLLICKNRVRLAPCILSIAFEEKPALGWVERKARIAVIGMDLSFLLA